MGLACIRQEHIEVITASPHQPSSERSHWENSWKSGNPTLDQSCLAWQTWLGALHERARIDIRLHHGAFALGVSKIGRPPKVSKSPRKKENSKKNIGSGSHTHLDLLRQT